MKVFKITKDTMDKNYIKDGLNMEKHKIRPYIIVNKCFLISLKNMKEKFEKKEIDMSQVQRKFSDRIHIYQGFIADLLNLINGNMNCDKEISVEDVQCFYDEENILRVLNGQHRIKWIIKFINEDDNGYIPASLLNNSYGKQKIYFSDLPKEVQEKFLKLQFYFKVYFIGNRRDEVDKFMELNCCSKKLDTKDKVFSEHGYAKFINVFKFFQNICDFWKNPEEKITNTKSILSFCDSGKFNKIEILKRKELGDTAMLRFYGYISYCLGLQVNGNTGETIGNLIDFCDNFDEEETVIKLFNNFSYLFKLMIDTNNSCLKNLLNTSKNCHLVRPLIKYVYNEINAQIPHNADDFMILENTEIEKAFNSIDFKNAISKINNYLISDSYSKSTFQDYKQSEKIYEELKK